jgi:hypothetical protein
MRIKKNNRKHPHETGRTLKAGVTGAAKHASKTAFRRPFYAHNTVRSQPIRTFEVSIDRARRDRLNKREKIDPQLSKSSRETL